MFKPLRNKPRNRRDHPKLKLEEIFVRTFTDTFHGRKSELKRMRLLKDIVHKNGSFKETA